MFFAVIMLINNKLKPVPKTNALRNDRRQGISDGSESTSFQYTMHLFAEP